MKALEKVIADAHQRWINDPDCNPHWIEDGEEQMAEAIAQAVREYLLSDEMVERASIAAKSAMDTWHLRFGGFLYEARTLPHVIREYGPEGGEDVFETADPAEFDAEYEKRQRHDHTRAALSAALEGS